MSNRTYETHLFKNKMLPFIFHHINLTDKSAVLTNWHTNAELLYCVGGVGQVFCDTEYNSFKKGDIIVVNSEVLHRVITDTKIEYYCLIIGNDFCKENGINTDNERFVTHINDSTLNNLFNNLIINYQSIDELSVPKIRFAVFSLLIELYENFKLPNESKNEESINSERIKQITLFIKEHYNERLTLDLIAKKAMINKYYLAHEFKRYTSQTIIEFINLVRCKEVKQRIKNGESISNAATECGFENMSYFTRTYKKFMGVLPSEHKHNK